MSLVMRVAALIACVSLATSAGMAHGADQDVTAIALAALTVFPGIAVLSCMALDWGTVAEQRERIYRLKTELRHTRENAAQAHEDALREGFAAGRNQPAEFHDWPNDPEPTAEADRQEADT